MTIQRGNCFRLLSVSWPRMAQHDGRRWTSDPDWDAPVMPQLPPWQLRTCGRDTFYAIDWRQAFSTDLTFPGRPGLGEMRGFYVVFQLRVELGGRMVFLDTDGCIIRRNGTIVHEDRDPHPPERHELCVSTGDRLEIAQWQQGGDWSWGVRRVQGPNDVGCELLTQYLPAIEEALRRPNGPVVKMFTSAVEPLRCALSAYSLILNGYRPAGFQIFGGYQWDDSRRAAMQQLFPFAEIVPIARVEEELDRRDSRLLPRAREFWGAMKTCVSLFMPPYDYCHLDDDIFVLERLDDALALHGQHDLVFAPDDDYGSGYQAIWCPSRTGPLSTATVNTGFYFHRHRGSLTDRIDRFMTTPPEGHKGFLWEQGFFAAEFTDSAIELPSQRYFYPLFDGLPGGFLGYDWLANPCEFTTVHFGGPRPKPTERETAALVHDILRRRRAA